jgi:hypothetical protein
MSEKIFKKIDETKWLLPQSYKQGMRVPGLVIATEKLIEGIEKGVHRPARKRGNASRDI